ncbi:hypothetical protein K502DRAFT_324949 [Neoconidiobolus thromboides FSU 785]|nr:hypothetical protein K502DRAFT_324949 [Neoconidiobolus thromboides FSU 785]
MSVGYEHFDLNAIKQFELKNNIKIKLGFTPDVLTDAVAEINIGLALTVMRRLFEAQSAAINGNWKQWSPNWLLGHQLSNKTIGLLGFGRIGKATYERLLPFKPKQLLYYKRTLLQQSYENLIYSNTMESLLSESDIIFINIDLNPDTIHLIDYSKLSLMKKEAILINSSRGQIINQDDLVKVLRENKLGGVGLDVTTPEPLSKNHPLFIEFKNKVTIFPHIGSATVETRNMMGDLALDNLLTGINDQELKTEIKY